MIPRFLITAFVPITFLMSQNSCEPQYISNSRVYAEGNVSSVNRADIAVKLFADDILISETATNRDGNFALGGPGTSGEKTLYFNRKIISFNTSNKDCSLSYDSLSIILPAKNTSYKFPQIVLEQ